MAPQTFPEGITLNKGFHSSASSPSRSPRAVGQLRLTQSMSNAQASAKVASATPRPPRSITRRESHLGSEPTLFDTNSSPPSPSNDDELPPEYLLHWETLREDALQRQRQLDLETTAADANNTQPTRPDPNELREASAPARLHNYGTGDHWSIVGVFLQKEIIALASVYHVIPRNKLSIFFGTKPYQRRVVAQLVAISDTNATILRESRVHANEVGARLGVLYVLREQLEMDWQGKCDKVKQELQRGMPKVEGSQQATSNGKGKERQTAQDEWRGPYVVPLVTEDVQVGTKQMEKKESKK